MISVCRELFLSYDEHLDRLTLIEFGQVENAQPRDHWRGVNESFGFLLRHGHLAVLGLSTERARNGFTGS